MNQGEKLTAVMQKYSITQQDIADAAGVSQPTISRMRTNKMNVNYKLLKYLRVKFKVNINQFFDDK